MVTAAIIGSIVGSITGGAWWFVGYKAVSLLPETGMRLIGAWNWAVRFGGIAMMGVSTLVLIIAGLVSHSPEVWWFFWSWAASAYGLIAIYYYHRYVLEAKETDRT
jgi:hypothetical protein